MLRILTYRLFAGFVLFGLILNFSVQGQVPETPPQDSVTRGSLNWVAIPVIFYTPETNWTFGAGVYTTFRFRNEPDWTKPSQFQLGAGYTLNNQILAYTPYRVYFGKEKNLIYGEIGFYTYQYYFYGIGNYPLPADRESFDVTFPRVRLNMMRKVGEGFYAGVRYWFEKFNITEVESGGLLASGTIPGADGGAISGIGLIGDYDSRDDIIWPTQGVFGQVQLFRNTTFLGSDFNYSRFSVDVAKYIGFSWGHVFAQNVLLDFEAGNPPFNQMAMLGGPRKMRGLYEGQFRDRNAILYQAEYRAPIVWRIGVVGFIGLGMVASKFEDFALANTRVAGGAGLRFALLKKDRLNLRVDYGWAPNGGGFYFTVGEAF